MWWHTGGPAGWSDGHVLILDTNDTRLPPHWAGNFETFNALWTHGPIWQVKLETLTKSMCIELSVASCCGATAHGTR